jgi:DNA-directed RNA polymerase specialized sigma24 family protein
VLTRSPNILKTIRRVLAGERSAWTELWQKAEPIVVEVSRRATTAYPIRASEDERRSVVVLTMARLEADGFRRLRLFLEDAERRNDPAGDETRFVAWLATVATRVAIDRARKVRPAERANAASDPIEAGAEITDRRAPDIERRATARGVLQSARHELTQPQFDALVAWLVGDDASDIARRLHLADANEAERLVRSAIKRLRDRYRTNDEKGTPS